MSVPRIPYTTKRLHTPFEESYALKIIGGIIMYTVSKKGLLVILSIILWNIVIFTARFKFNVSEDTINIGAVCLYVFVLVVSIIVDFKKFDSASVESKVSE